MSFKVKQFEIMAIKVGISKDSLMTGWLLRYRQQSASKDAFKFNSDILYKPNNLIYPHG